MDHEQTDIDGRGPARGARRDSLFLLTVITSPEGRDLGSARVRNLSATGLMADSDQPFSKGDRVSMQLRGVGRVEGTIAWAKDQRIGIAFDETIDPQLARKPVAAANKAETLVPTYLQGNVKLPRR